jgi:hypothetical protein
MVAGYRALGEANILTFQPLGRGAGVSSADQAVTVERNPGAPKLVTAGAAMLATARPKFVRSDHVFDQWR